MTALVRSFSEDIDYIINSHQSKTACVQNDGIVSVTTSYQELDALISRGQTLLAQLGLVKEDIMLAIMPNSLETLVIFIAAMKSGIGFAPLPCTATPYEVQRWANLIKPRICFFTSLLKAELKDKLNDMHMSKKEIVRDSSFSWLPSASAEINAEQTARIYLSTSGTTGEPKAMVMDINRLWSSGYAFVEHHHLQKEYLRFWNYLPMSYLGGLFNLALIPFATGGSIYIDEPFSGKTFLTFWQTVEQNDINAVWFVPSIVRGLLKLAERRSPQACAELGEKIRAAFLGTAPIDFTTKKTFSDTFGIELLENFALSETTFFTSEAPQELHLRKEGSVGRVLPYTEVRLAETDEDADPHHREICVKTPFMMLGYLQSDGTLTRPVDDKGFFSTGDIGYLDKDDQLIITGRKRDIIKKSGNFIALREIEVLLEDLSCVNEAIAVPVTHPFHGEDYVLYVIPNSDEHTVIDTVNNYIHEKIIDYKWPQSVKLKASLPRTASGKVRKNVLRDEYESGK